MDALSSPNNAKEPIRLRGLFDLSHALLIFTILVALSFVVVLANDNINQRSVQVRLRSELATSNGNLSGPSQAQVGDVVPSFEGVSLSGKATKVLFNDQFHYLLFFMSLDCGACLGQIPIWNSIVEEMGNGKCSVFGVVTGPKSVTVPPVSFELLSMPNISVQRAYRVVALPSVMLVSKSGRVEWVHYGKLTEDLRLDLLSAIKKNSNGDSY